MCLCLAGGPLHLGCGQATDAPGDPGGQASGFECQGNQNASESADLDPKSMQHMLACCALFEVYLGNYLAHFEGSR